MQTSNQVQTVREQTLRAYSDCHSVPPYGRAHVSHAYLEERLELRQLDFRASEPVSRGEAIAIMAEAVPDGYNEFRAEVLNALPLDARVMLARENSVCIYFATNHAINIDDLREAMDADEGSIQQNSDGKLTLFRVWWD